MRVLLAHNRYQYYGGEDAVVDTERELLTRFGDEVRFYERDNAVFGAAATVEKIKALVTPFWSRRTYQDICQIIQDFRPDIVHCHNIFYCITPSIYDACEKENIPVVQSVHNYRPFCLNGIFLRDNVPCELCVDRGLGPGIRYRCFRDSLMMSGVLAGVLSYHQLRKTWQNKVDRYIAATQFTRGKYVAAGVAEHKISVKPHCVLDPPQTVRNSQRHAVYIGRLSEEKGVRVLLQAWTGLKDVPLKVIGDGPLLPELKDYVSEQGLGNVEFLGHLTLTEPKDKQAFEEAFATAHCLLIPSLCYENFPRVVAEAYARGVPVIASRSGSLMELIADGETGLLFDPGDQHDLIAKVRRSFADPDSYAVMRLGARERFEQVYAPETNHGALRGIYEQTINDYQK